MTEIRKGEAAPRFGLLPAPNALAGVYNGTVVLVHNAV